MLATDLLGVTEKISRILTMLQPIRIPISIFIALDGIAAVQIHSDEPQPGMIPSVELATRRAAKTAPAPLAHRDRQTNRELAQISVSQRV